jgi:hypothetical protein
MGALLHKALIVRPQRGEPRGLGGDWGIEIDKAITDAQLFVARRASQRDARETVKIHSQSVPGQSRCTQG